MATKDDINLEGAKINIIIENDGLFMSEDYYYAPNTDADTELD